MMKAKLILSLLPAIFALSSCGETKPKEGAPVLELSGAFAFSDSIESYADVKTKRSAESLISEAEAGLPTFVLFSRESCSWCKRFEPHFLKAMKKLKRNIHVYYYDEDVSDQSFVLNNLHVFQEKYGTNESEGGISGKVPAMYYLDGTKMNVMDMYDDNGSTYKFISYMQYETIGSSFYRFDSFSLFERAMDSDSSIRKILYDPSDLTSRNSYSEEFNLNHDTKTYVLDYSLLSDYEKSEALIRFGLTSYSFKII